jgi:Ca2+-binding RTX toxin-like protein
LDTAIESSAAGGSDTVRSSVSYTLGANVENLVLTGTGAIAGTGNALANSLTGNAGANLLNGGAGADNMAGGNGNDVYIVDNALDKVLEESTTGGTDEVRSAVAYTLGSNLEKLTLTGSAAVAGTGNSLANLITGNGAANRLDGGAGADTMRGGGGNDTYIVDNVGDKAIEASAADGVDTVQSTVSFALGANVEKLVLTGTATVNATGNGLANSLAGNSAANVLNGGAGADVMTGGAGDDTYVVDNAADKAVEALGGGNDSVISSVEFTLGANVENLTLTGNAAIAGTGNGLANVVNGNTADNVLRGGAGDDVLRGGGGADALVGGEGSDSLKGGDGADRFLFNAPLGPSNVDRVIDFVRGTDKLALDNAVFGTLPAGALAPAAFVVGTAAGDASDRIIYDPATGALWYDRDGTGAAAAVQFAVLDTKPATLAATDFIVI